MATSMRYTIGLARQCWLHRQIFSSR